MKLSIFSALILGFSFSIPSLAEDSDSVGHSRRVDAFLERVAKRVDITVEEARTTFCGEDGCRGRVREIVRNPENRQKFRDLLSRARDRIQEHRGKLSIFGRYIRNHLKDCHAKAPDSDTQNLSPFADHVRAPASAPPEPKDTTAPALVTPE